ncbi:MULTISPECIES: hypothetical protein [Mucilaginibacter]|nr:MULTISPECIES: hypothetical protein [Mucilaginibacter]
MQAQKKFPIATNKPNILFPNVAVIMTGFKFQIRAFNVNIMLFND